MNVEHIFNKPLTRDINGVVKAEQLDNASVYVELDEYVVTRELERNIRPTLPRDIEIYQIFDTSDQITQSISNVSQTVRWGIGWTRSTSLPKRRSC